MAQTCYDGGCNGKVNFCAHCEMDIGNSDFVCVTTSSSNSKHVHSQCEKNYYKFKD